MSREKQNIKSSDWLIRRYSEEELANMKEQALKEAEAELRDKQIDEMAKLICTFPQCINHNIMGGCKASECNIADKAEALYNAGYRKQSEGEWIIKKGGYYQRLVCSVCERLSIATFDFCPNCGAYMGGKNE